VWEERKTVWEKRKTEWETGRGNNAKFENIINER
jgi:hypothetical protein